MKNETIIYGALSGVGGILIGLFVNKLNTIYGGALFTFGLILLVFSNIKLKK